MEEFSPRRIRQLVLLGILLALGIVLFRELYFLLPAFLGALTLFLLLDKPYRWLAARKVPPLVSSVSLMIVASGAILLPLVWSAYVVMQKIGMDQLSQENLLHLFTSLDDGFYDLTGFHLTEESNLKALAGYGQQILPQLLGTLGHVGVNVGVMYFILFFMLTERKLFLQLISRLVPLESRYLGRLQKELASLILVNALGIPLLGLVQAVVAMGGYALLGIPDAVFWGLMTGVASVVPVVGTMLVWIPMALYYVSQEAPLTALYVLLYGFLVIGSSDNLIRAILQKRLGNIHPLTTLLGVFVGLSLFGFLGLIFGPVLISAFFLLLRFYAEEFGHGESTSHQRPGARDGT
ncbi:MAG: AI-2E family transporter [Flavobacteriales bacterium]|nr:AI-2E family transporter [Flavobacteriales bacterium]MDW8432994.1 AI-2E family transporter [Flavobacteriales bacterium]